MQKRGFTLIEVVIGSVIMLMLFIPFMITRSTEQQRIELLREDLFVTGLMEDCAAVLADVPNSWNLRKFLVSTGNGWRLELPANLHPRKLRYPHLGKGWVEPEFEKAYLGLYARTDLRMSAEFRSTGDQVLHYLICRFDWVDSRGRKKSRTIERLVVGLINSTTVQRARAAGGNKSPSL